MGVPLLFWTRIPMVLIFKFSFQEFVPPPPLKITVTAMWVARHFLITKAPLILQTGEEEIGIIKNQWIFFFQKWLGERSWKAVATWQAQLVFSSLSLTCFMAQKEPCAFTSAAQFLQPLLSQFRAESGSPGRQPCSPQPPSLTFLDMAKTGVVSGSPGLLELWVLLFQTGASLGYVQGDRVA